MGMRAVMQAKAVQRQIRVIRGSKARTLHKRHKLIQWCGINRGRPHSQTHPAQTLPVEPSAWVGFTAWGHV